MGQSWGLCVSWFTSTTCQILLNQQSNYLQTIVYFSEQKPMNLNSQIFQKDLHSLVQWENTWQIEFSRDKCEPLYVINKCKPLLSNYEIHGITRPNAKLAKYLGMLAQWIDQTIYILTCLLIAGGLMGFLVRFAYAFFFFLFFQPSSIYII